MQPVLEIKAFQSDDDEYCDDVYQAVTDWSIKISNLFFSSEVGKKFGKDRTNYGSFFIQMFSELAYNYCSETPGQWTPDTVEEVCLSLFPRKLSINSKHFKHVTPVMIAFLSWMEEKRIITDTADLQATFKEIKDDIEEEADDPANWGLAKSLLGQGW